MADEGPDYEQIPERQLVDEFAQFKDMLEDRMPIWAMKIAVALDPESGHQVYSFTMVGDNLQISNVVGTLESIKLKINGMSCEHEH